MKLINAALAEKNVKIKELPKELQQDISKLKEMVVKYNMACDEYENEEEEDAQIEKKLDEQEDILASFEGEIAANIKGYEKNVKNLIDQNSASVVSSDDSSDTENKGSSVGWLIFGSAVLLVTLGAVNVFKKRA